MTGLICGVSGLSLAEYWYNTNFYSAAQMMTYEAVYGLNPPQHVPYLPGESKVAVSLKVCRNVRVCFSFLNFIFLDSTWVFVVY